MVLRIKPHCARDLVGVECARRGLRWLARAGGKRAARRGQPRGPSSQPAALAPQPCALRRVRWTEPHCQGRVEACVCRLRHAALSSDRPGDHFRRALARRSALPARPAEEVACRPLLVPRWLCRPRRDARRSRATRGAHANLSAGPPTTRSPRNYSPCPQPRCARRRV